MPEPRPDNPKLRIGLLVDSTSVSAGIFELVKWCQKNNDLELSCLLNTDRRAPWNSATREKCLSWIVKLEAMLIRGSKPHKPAKNHDLCRLTSNTITAKPNGTECPDIKALQLDIVLITGSGAIPRDFCSVAKLGVIRIHYGHPCATGFWEVFHKQDYTGFAIRQLCNTPDSEVDLVSGQIATQYCYSMNKSRIEHKCLYYTKQLLSRIASERTIPEPKQAPKLAKSTKRMPSLLIQARYLMQLCFRFTHRAIRSAFRLDFKWSVAYQISGWQNVDMAGAVKIPRPDNHFLADPFVVSENGRDYCFLEDYDYRTAKGHVAVFELHADRAECLGNALVEPFHLSFPYLFRYKSELYMCPETSRNRQIRVYKCLQFPLKWQLHSVLMDDVSAAETMLFEQDGRWWMLTNMDVTETGDYCTELSIFWADSPLSNHWTAHPANPVFIDAEKGRNAGLLLDADTVYRVAQKQGFERYGKAFSINRIEQLDEATYREIEVRSVQADFFPNIKGTHHMHSNGTATVFDFI